MLRYNVTMASETIVSLYTLKGDLIRSLPTGKTLPGSREESLDVSGLTPGVYIARIECRGEKGKVVFMNRFVKE